MKRALLTLVLIVFAADAQAISRYSSTSMSCAKVQATIARDGAAIMRYASKRTPGLPLYGRYVRSSQFCKSDETTQTTTIRAADTDACRVKECIQQEFDDPLLWRRD